MSVVSHSGQNIGQGSGLSRTVTCSVVTSSRGHVEVEGQEACRTCHDEVWGPCDHTKNPCPAVITPNTGQYPHTVGLIEQGNGPLAYIVATTYVQGPAHGNPKHPAICIHNPWDHIWVQDIPADHNDHVVAVSLWGPWVQDQNNPFPPLCHRDRT